MLVNLGGDLTFPHAPRIRECLLEAFTAMQHVGLDLGEIREIDLSFLQLLCAAHRTALAEGKEITLLNRELPAPLREVAGAAGFVNRSGCPAACRCWLSRGQEPVG